MGLPSFEVAAEVRIDAPLDAVWRTLTEVEAWSQWCTWLRWEGGAMRVGERLHLRLSPPDGGGYTFWPEVLVLDAPHHLAWVGRTGVRGVFDGEHHFLLSPDGDGGTRLVNRERYSGVAAPIVRRLPAMRGAQPGFVAMNEEIRARAEALARASLSGSPR